MLLGAATSADIPQELHSKSELLKTLWFFCHKTYSDILYEYLRNGFITYYMIYENVFHKLQCRYVIA